MKNSFLSFVTNESKKPYFIKLQERINQEAKNHVIYPEQKNIYRALNFFEANETKVIILGQDPYPAPNQADGLAFSTYDSKTPKSLQNMIKEIKKDYPEAVFETNLLDYWATQKVLLLNTCLSVNQNYPNSHKNFGWETFVINLLNFVIEQNPNVLFGILGNNAKNIVSKLNIPEENKIISSHPSPLGYYQGFENSHFFKKINDKLEQKIDFSIRKVN
ncbi:uracil-DNA glycosylase [Mycoplasmopsis hyopharyngis]|uniref:uracil-DNA glycosylase n=1 Tax=Mycoplasmopsis hyopharyngis TaxID=29558 RepID=UPI003872D6DF